MRPLDSVQEELPVSCAWVTHLTAVLLVGEVVRPSVTMALCRIVLLHMQTLAITITWA
jgi:hypothetical protein